MNEDDNEKDEDKIWYKNHLNENRSSDTTADLPDMVNRNYMHGRRRILYRRYKPQQIDYQGMQDRSSEDQNESYRDLDLQYNHQRKYKQYHYRKSPMLRGSYRENWQKSSILPRDRCAIDGKQIFRDRDKILDNNKRHPNIYIDRSQYETNDQKNNFIKDVSEIVSNENDRFAYIRDQSHMRKCLNTIEQKDYNTEPKNRMKTHYEEYPNINEKHIKEKSITEHLYDVVNDEAKRLEIYPSRTRNRPSLYYLFDVVQEESEKLRIDSSDVSESPKPQRRRGRPVCLSPDIKKINYDHLGVRRDSEGGIDFDDKMFNSMTVDNKKIFLCPLESCKKNFPSLSRAKRHYIVHTGEKPFRCYNEKCHKTFSRKDNMLQHWRAHCAASKESSRK